MFDLAVAVVRVIASIVVGAVVLREAWRHLMRNW